MENKENVEIVENKKNVGAVVAPPPKGAGISLIPFLVFIALFLGVGLFLDSQNVNMAFYQFPAPVAVFIGVIVAFFMLKGKIEEKMTTFVKGCGEENIIIMIIIFMLAAAFSDVARATGGVSSLVNMGLTFIPPQFLAAGLFIISCIMSICIGTSMGTIAAIGPIAVGLATAADLNMGLTMAGVVGGAMFGDNLSIISDTTIAVTRGLGVEMIDKFKLNFGVAIPAAIITVIIMIITGVPDTVHAAEVGDWNILLIIPYIIVLVAAVSGMNVFVVLTMGIALTGIVGFATGAFTQNMPEALLAAGYVEGHFFYGIVIFAREIQAGFASMIPVIFTSLLIGGLAAMIRNAGGLEFLIFHIRKFIKGKKSAEVGMAVMISATDAAIANNTVALIVTCPVIKDLAYEYKVDPRRAASISDIFACVMQGIIPYGAQILLAVGLAGGAVSAMDIIPLLWYQWLLAIFCIIYIFVPFADFFIRGNPWNFEHKMDTVNARKKGLIP